MAVPGRRETATSSGQGPGRGGIGRGGNHKGLCSGPEISGCQECGGCDKTGECVIPDEMDGNLSAPLEHSDYFFIFSDLFLWVAGPGQDAGRPLPGPVVQADAGEISGTRKRYDHGRGYLIAVGATKGKNLFEGVQLTAKYFFDALDKSYEGGLFFRAVEGKGRYSRLIPLRFQEAYDLGVTAVRNTLKQNNKHQTSTQGGPYDHPTALSRL